ncbi:MAG: hypothetical protein ACOCS6_04085, partial [Desulfosalsimonas sp.]
MIFNRYYLKTRICNASGEPAPKLGKSQTDQYGGRMEKKKAKEKTLPEIKEITTCESTGQMLKKA